MIERLLKSFSSQAEKVKSKQNSTQKGKSKRHLSGISFGKACKCKPLDCKCKQRRTRMQLELLSERNARILSGGILL